MTQTGVQILTAFLLMLPFQARFAELSGRQVALYLSLMVLAIVTTALMVAPVSLHRFLFQRGRKVDLVRIANRITGVGLITLGLLIVGTVGFVFDVVLGGPASWVAPIAAAILLLSLWIALPWRTRRADAASFEA
ncbi:hypothetical protein LEUCIP111803_01238 [Leucobacter soli]|uniref:Sodium:proton antiporter n=1 Tax=Leucobacter soli TaxID=2812850 RepID=A0A916NVN9_9MICO|nr:hypothetical protein LEUCIP111803_01238 [Leucobacter soli]